MYTGKSFWNYYIALLLLILLAGCQGNSCVEADDFGEYSTDIVIVDSKKASCAWTDNADYGEGSQVIADCLNMTFNDGTGNPNYNSNNSFSTYGGDCKIKLVDDAQDASCNTLKDAINNPSSDFSYFTFTSESGTDDTCKNTASVANKRLQIQAAYSTCLDNCVTQCEETNKNNFETDWESNNIQTIRGGPGIELSMGQTVEVQVQGAVTLLGNKESTIKFDNLKNNGVQSKDSNGNYVNLSTGVPLSLKGNWCKNSTSTNSCSANNIVGENDPKLPNIQKRTEFLRRGVIILDPLPNNTTLDINGKTIGAIPEPNFNAWKCSISSNFDVDNKTRLFSCKTEYTTDIPGVERGYEEINNEAYSFSDGFAKAIGGTVIPNNVRKYITKNPFDNVSCSTEDDPDTAKKIRKCDELESYQISSGSLGETSTLRNGYFLGQGGNKNELTINSIVYPSRIAFKIIPSKNEDGSIRDTAGTGSCKVTVSAPNLTKNGTVTVKADGKWYFLTDDGDKRTLLNRSEYNTLNRTENNRSEQDLNKKNAYTINITTEDGATWTDQAGNSIDCGQGLAVFLFPQNEIIFEKSGFVDFKNVLASNPQTISSCSNIDTKNNTCLTSNKNIELNFEIINPMYDFREASGDTTKTLLRNNFYEYLDEFDKPKRQTVSVPLSITNSGWSKNRIFVRKGQILRFNEDNWFDIETSDGASTIKSKVVNLSSTEGNGLRLSNVGDGLFVKVEERPALLCSGTATEKIENDTCNRQTDDNGNTTCSVGYTDICMNDKEVALDPTAQAITPSGSPNPDAVKKSPYCPFGCFGSFFVDSSLKDNMSCPAPFDEEHTSEEIGEDGKTKTVSAATCQHCKALIDKYSDSKNNNFKIDPTIDIELLQCYDLEDYAGSVRRLTVKDTTASNENADTAKNGNLTNQDLTLGAKKLAGILDGGTYGNFDGFTLDETKKSTDTSVDNDGNIISEYTELIYNSGGNLPFQTPRTLKFLLLDNEDFEFNKGYEKNTGSYDFILTPSEVDRNGSQLAVVLAHKDWDGKTFEPNTSDPTGFKSWIVKYETSKESNNYGTFIGDDGTNFHQIGSNGILTDATGTAKVDLSKLNLSGLTEDDYKDLRFFFKIIDRQEKTGCGGDKTKVEYTTEKCACKNKNSTQQPAAKNYKLCTEVSCGTNQEVVSKSETTCVSSYYNNEGKYTVQLKTPKSVINSTGYIVKYVMEPVLEILDGKTIGLRADTSGGYAMCQEGDYVYKYGGDVPKWRIGTVCSKKDPLIGKYCRETSEAYGTCISGTNCILPGLDKDKYGENCKDKNGNWRIDDYDKYCFPVSLKRCNIYNRDAPVGDNTFGKDCVPGDENCYQNCSTLESDLYSRCVYINDNSGFLQRFYQTVINDNDYQVILKLCFTLMIMFYGLYYLLGMADLTQSELIKRLIKIGFIYLMVGKDGWYYYNMFFVKFFKSGVDYLVFAIAGAFDDSASLQEAFITNDFYDKSVLFSGVDKNLALIFSDQVSFKIWGLLFVSFFGWIYVFLIYSAIIAYIMAVANALLLYLTAQFFVSMLLAFGPIFFVLLVFEKTKGMFDKWISNLISFSLEQIFLLTCLSLFNSLIYNVIKFVLSYKVCWKPVWVLNIPLLGSIELMSFWKATTSSSPTAAANAIPGLFQILIIYLVADLMKNFITFMADLGAKMGGSGLSSSGLSGDISKTVSDIYNKHIKNPLKDKVMNKVVLPAAKKLVGYRTKDEEKAEKKLSKELMKKRREVDKKVNKSIKDYRKNHMEELSNMTAEQRQKSLESVATKARDDAVNKDADLQKMLQQKGITAEQFKSRSAIGLSGATDLGGLLHDVNKSLLFGTVKSSNTKVKGVASSNNNTHISDRERKQEEKKRVKSENKALRAEMGSKVLMNKGEKAEYDRRKEEIKAESKERLAEGRKVEKFVWGDDADRKSIEKNRKDLAKSKKKSEKEAAKSITPEELKQRTAAKQEKFKADHKDFDPNKGLLARARENPSDKELRKQWNALEDEARRELIAEKSASGSIKKAEEDREARLKELAPTPSNGKDGKPGEPQVGILDPKKVAAYMDAQNEQAKKAKEEAKEKKTKDAASRPEVASNGAGVPEASESDTSEENSSTAGTASAGNEPQVEEKTGAEEKPAKKLGFFSKVFSKEAREARKAKRESNKKEKQQAKKEQKLAKKKEKASETDDKDTQQALRDPENAANARSGVGNTPDTPAQNGAPAGSEAGNALETPSVEDPVEASGDVGDGTPAENGPEVQQQQEGRDNDSDNEIDNNGGTGNRNGVGTEGSTADDGPNDPDTQQDDAMVDNNDSKANENDDRRRNYTMNPGVDDNRSLSQRFDDNMEALNNSNLFDDE